MTVRCASRLETKGFGVLSCEKGSLHLGCHLSNIKGGNSVLWYDDFDCHIEPDPVSLSDWNDMVRAFRGSADSGPALKWLEETGLRSAYEVASGQ